MIHHQDCIRTMARMAPASVDLIMTSPPYAGKRTDLYPAPDPAEFVDWWMARATGMARVLKPTGSLIVNIKEGTTDGERQTYVLELVLAMRRAGWLWVDEYIWHKPNPYPGKWPDRLKDGFERCHHFTRAPGFKFNPPAVQVPLTDYAIHERDHPVPSHAIDDDFMSGTGSGCSTNRTRIRMRTHAIPSNVISITLGNHTNKHPAKFPERLPSFFIKLLSDEGDLIYDPFGGSGSTAMAARELGRRWIMSEINDEYCQMAAKRLGMNQARGGQLG